MTGVRKSEPSPVHLCSNEAAVECSLNSDQVDDAGKVAPGQSVVSRTICRAREDDVQKVVKEHEPGKKFD